MRGLCPSWLAGVGAALVLSGCGSPEDAVEPLPSPTPVVWPEPVIFEPAGSFVAAHPAAFERISGFATHVSGPVAERPDAGHRGAVGTGNGRVFAMFGVGDPLNSMHSMVGPAYERRDRFFGDYSIHLVAAGSTAEPADYEEEWAARSLSAPVVLTRGRRGPLELDTVDFAPATNNFLERNCMVRVITVRNGGAEPSGPHDVMVVAANDVTVPEAGLLREETEARVLRTAFVGTDAASDDEVLRWSVGALEAGEERRAVLQHCAGESDSTDLMPTPDADALLDATVAAYQAWARDLVQVEVPDRMVADFIDGMKLTLKTQTTVDGASCPMSNYTRTWARDNIGPALAWLALGAHDEVRAMLDYLYGAVLIGGDLANSYDADLDLAVLPAPPDWDAMPVLGDRVAAETPSYMVWMYGAHQLHSGRLSRAEGRFGFLRRCLFAQDFSAESLLPFTGDETYRGAMNITFGLGIEYGHADKSYSANSSLLWLGAAHHFVRLAEALGRDADAERAREKYAEVEAALLHHYRLRDGCLSSHVSRETGQAWPAPYEDVALKATWAGWLHGDDPLARQLDTCHFNRLRSAAGQLQTFLEEDTSTGLLIEADAVYTGMLPGYALSALTRAGHVEASAAVNVLGAALSTTGNLQEYNVILGGERSGLTILYDTEGYIGDYTAKYRPWEGGIDVAALLDYLLGFRPNAPESSFELRPHLPVGWPSMAFRGLRVGDHRFDVEVVRLERGHEVRIRSMASSPYRARLRWDAPRGAVLDVRVDGELLAEDRLRRFEHFGLQSVQTPGLPLRAGSTLHVQL